MTRSPDRAVESAWRLTLVFLTFAAGCAAVFMLYRAFFAGIDANWAEMGIQVLLAAGISGGVWWLCAHRAELVGEL